MKKIRPITVSNTEVLRSVDERIAGADDARQNRLEALETVAVVRSDLQARELERLTQKHGKAHPLVAETQSRLQAGNASLRALRFEMQRTALTPPKPTADGWTVFGIVRGKDGAPLPEVSVSVVDANGDIVAPDKALQTEENGAFSIVLARAPRRARRVKAAAEEEQEKGDAGSVHLEVFRGGRRVAVDTVPFQPTPGVVDYREFVVGL